MAVTRRDNSAGNFEYYGLSGDTKPNVTTTPAGSTFLETDTGLRFLNTGAAWVGAGSTTTVFGAGTAIIGKVEIDQTLPGSALSQFTTAITPSNAISAKASAGNLMSLNCTNANATVRYLQIHDKATAPANTNVPVAAWPIPAGSANAPGAVSLGILEWGTAGYRCALGIAIGISTTLGTYTAATAADHIVNGSYV